MSHHKKFDDYVEGEKTGYGKILMSDVTVTRKRNLFRDRIWNIMDVRKVLWFLIIHSVTLFAPFTFTWGAFWAAFFGYVLGMLGITLSYHRNLAHRSLTLPKWLEYTFAYFAIQTAQGDPIFWVSMHRYHHQFVDADKDPHSPTYGFWFSHMGWLFDENFILEKYQGRKNVEDLKSQVFYTFIHRTYFLHIIGLAAIVYALGGFPYLVWVMAVRLTCTYHFTFLVNSACHIWGSRVWNTNDLSKNNMWVALVTSGEGWHNNHHAFEYSARLGLEWWQFDPCWNLIQVLKVLGLATNVKEPKKADKLKKTYPSLNQINPSLNQTK